MTSTSLPFAVTLSAFANSIPASTLFCCARSSSARCTPFSSRPGMLRSLAVGVPVAMTYASNACPRSAAMSSPVTMSFPSGSVTSTPYLKVMPSFSIRSMRRSMMSLLSLKFGMPYLSSPPAASFLSKTVTAKPCLFRRLAATSPAGPAPMTATVFPLRSYVCGMIYFSLHAASVMAHSSSRLVTGSWLVRLSTHDFSHSAGQMRPVNSGKSFVSVSLW